MENLGQYNESILAYEDALNSAVIISTDNELLREIKSSLERVNQSNSKSINPSLNHSIEESKIN
jgi:hypothetical protein